MQATFIKDVYKFNVCPIPPVSHLHSPETARGVRGKSTMLFDSANLYMTVL